MRKFLLSAVALLMTATMLAVGKGDGSSQANAIDFDWDGTYIHEGNKTSWHCIKLSELNEEADDPTVALYLTNLTNETANVELSGSAFLRFPYPVSLFVDDIDLLQYAGEDATETYKIDGKKHVVWTMPTSYDLSGITDAKVKDALSDAFGDIKNVSLIQLVEYGLSTVDLKVYSSQKIAISADVYETAEIVDDACTKAVDFDWAGETVAAGETWFYLDLNAVKTSNKKLNFVVENNGGADANVAFDLYADCPASAILLDYDWAIAAGGEVKEALGRFFLDQMTRDYVYLKLTTDQAVTLKAEEEVLPPPVVLFDPSDAPVLEMGKEYVLNGETVLKVDLAALKAPKGYKTVCHIVNPNDAAVNLKQEIAFATPVTSNNVQEKNLLVAAGAELEMNIPNKQIENVKSGVGYYRFTTDDVLTVMMEHVKLETSTTKPSTPTILAPSCADSYEFDWNSTIKQKALTSKWYELDIAPLKNNKEHVQLAFTNHTDAMILVFGTVKLDCNSKDSIPFVCPVPAGTPVNKVLDYSLLAASPLEKVYVSLTMVPTKVKDLGDLASIRSKADVVDLVSLDLGAEMSVKAKRISALVDPTYCETTHQTMTTGVEYTQEAGTTKWYRVTDDFVKNNLGLLEKFTIINQGAKDANVTFGVTVDCQYGIATTIDQKIPRWFDITTAYPSGLFRLVDAIVADEITEFYLSVTSDQPLLFGFDLDYGTTLGCDSAIVFDWEKGATINNMDAQWYNFDLTKIKGSGKHLKLTFTNPTDEIVWVASAVSLTCPLKVVAPAIVPVLPGTSVDKVIDYSFVATNPINNVYVAVIAEGQLKLGASLIDATVEEPLNCINHVEVKTGERYVHKAGTTWYKFSNDLLADMGKAPRFTFENLSSNTITLSAGMTVDCEYGILTRAKAKIPAQVLGKPIHHREFSVRIPRIFFQAVRKLIDPDVTELMIQLTANNPFAFSIDMKAEDACEDAQEFNWEGCFDLKANESAWYKVDMNTPLNSTEPLSVALYNNSDFPVMVTAEVSPTCPVLISMVEKYEIAALDSIIVSVKPEKVAEMIKEYSDYLNDLSCYTRFHATGDVTICVNDERIDNPDDPTPDEPCCPEECEDVPVLDWKMVTLSKIELNQLYKLDITGLYDQPTINFFVNNDVHNDTVGIVSEIYAHCQDATPVATHKNNVIAGFSMVQVPHDKFAGLVDEKQCCMFVKYTAIDTVPVTPVVPPTDPCANVPALDWRAGIKLSQLTEGGWYKLEVASVHADKADVMLSVENDLACQATVGAALYTTCQVDDAVMEGTAKLNAGAVGDTLISYNVFNGMVESHVEYLYMHINTLKVADDCDPCANVETLDWENGIKLSQLAVGHMYKLDLSNVQAAQSAFSIKAENDLGYKARVSAVAYSYCEANEDNFLGDATKQLAADYVAETMVPYADLYGAVGYATEVYVVVTKIVNLDDPCADIEELNWRDGVRLSTLNAGWYKLYVGDVHANKENVTAKVINDLTCDATVTAAVYSHCESDEVIADGSKLIKLGETTKTVSYADFAGSVPAYYGDYLYVNIESIVEECEKDTVINNVTEFICDGEEYVDALGEKHIISSLIDPALLTWSVSVETETTVTVYNYVITPIVAPVAMTAELLATIPGAMPKLVAGENVDVTGTLDAIKNYYEAQDTEAVADVESVEWTAGANATLDCEADVHTMTLTLTAGCDFVITTTLTLAVEGANEYVEYTEVACDSYVWNGVTYTESGDYTYTTTTAAGCERVEVLHLTINKSEREEYTETACDSYEWHGVTYTTSGDYTYNTTTAAGCERVEVLHLTINKSEREEYTETACDSYEWHGVTYTESGDYTYNTTTAAGCERVEVLHLTINKSEHVELTEVACGSYEWHGVTYTESGDYTYNTTTAAGCERVEVLHLTINKSEHVEFTEVACDSYEWHGVTYTESGDYTYNTTTAAGCERVEVLHLTINKSEHVEFTEVACDSYEWHGVTYTASGDYTYNTTTAAGCERVEVLHLTINKTVYEDITVTECYSYTWYGETYVRDTVVSVTVAGDNGCDRVETLHLTITAETPEANPAFSNVVAVPKYGNRMIVLHLNDFVKDNGWTPANGQVAWYQVVGEMDNSWEIVDDQPLGSGMYIENLNGFTGEIYAIIDASNGGACGSLYRTAKITLDPVAQAPKLMPTVANPSETLHLTNLNPSNVTEVRVFNTNGELMATYEAEAATEFVFKAAVLPGYYMVEVQNNGEQTTLRYIVK